MTPDLCPFCNCPNDCQLCGTTTHKGPCWCTAVTLPNELLARVPSELKNRACICKQCVAEFSKQPQTTTTPVGDFYFDKDGLMVFTAEYHLRRGYCCGSGCRHCPYPDAR